MAAADSAPLCASVKATYGSDYVDGVLCTGITSNGALLTNTQIANGRFFTDTEDERRMPVVIAARTALGTINHTTLTVRELRRAGAAVKGVCNPEGAGAETRARADVDRATIYREYGLEDGQA